MNFTAFVNVDYGVISDFAELETDAEIDGKLIVNERNVSLELYVGMEFESEEAAMVYYDTYAKHVGFIIWVGKWVVMKLETEYSHPLGIPSGKGRRCTVQAQPLDEKDKKIRELSAELHRANQQLAECSEQPEMVLHDIEQHTNHLNKVFRT
ncbi:hypothetical protein Patl1_03134 [Pistacia atlantica]|uniref:Uncharacterized protein n=1 Tax=Pistacia atlantica TaxID=434234 RepID=A0ACC1C992_9ROSI|nr:hypothetical protein Patl1_03134 [Pistacia atlantica]